MKEAKDKEVVDLEGRTKKVLNNMVSSFERMRDEANSAMLSQDKYWSFIIQGVKEEAIITDHDLLLAGLPTPLVVECLSLDEAPKTAQLTYKTVHLKKKDGTKQTIPFEKVAKDVTPFAKAFQGNGVQALVMGDPDAILKVIQKLYGADVVSWSVPAEESGYLFPSLQAAILVELYNVAKFQKESALFEKNEDKIEAYGIKGMKSIKWRKIFKSVDALNKWADANDAEVQGTRDVEESAISEVQSKEYLNCAYCKGKGYKMKEGEKEKCPHCKGRGYKKENKKQKAGLVVKEDAPKKLADAFDKDSVADLLAMFPNVLPDYPRVLVQESKTVLNLLSSDEMARLFPNINMEYLKNLKESELQALAKKLQEGCSGEEKKAKKSEKPVDTNKAVTKRAGRYTAQRMLARARR